MGLPSGECSPRRRKVICSSIFFRRKRTKNVCNSPWIDCEASCWSEAECENSHCWSPKGQDIYNGEVYSWHDHCCSLPSTIRLLHGTDKALQEPSGQCRIDDFNYVFDLQLLEDTHVQLWDVTVFNGSLLKCH